MNTFLVFFAWCVVLFFYWPVALLALILFPIVWLLVLPLRLIGVCVHGLFALGTTGEGPSLSYRLRCELIDRVCEQVAPGPALLRNSAPSQ